MEVSPKEIIQVCSCYTFLAITDLFQTCAQLLYDAETTDSYTSFFEKLPTYLPDPHVDESRIEPNSENLSLPPTDAIRLLDIMMPYLMLDVLIFATRREPPCTNRSVDEKAAALAIKPFSQSKDVAALDGVRSCIANASHC